MLKFEESSSVHREEEYKGIIALLKDVPLYNPQQITDKPMSNLQTFNNLHPS